MAFPLLPRLTTSHTMQVEHSESLAAFDQSVTGSVLDQPLSEARPVTCQLVGQLVEEPPPLPLELSPFRPFYTLEKLQICA